MWGVATSGTLIANGISGEGTDPFFPAIYGKTTNVADATEKVDGCLAHPQQQGVFHYHMSSPCVADPSIVPAKGDSDVLKTARTFDKKYRTPYGISKDGRVIYSLYYSDGMTYSGC